MSDSRKCPDSRISPPHIVLYFSENDDMCREEWKLDFRKVMGEPLGPFLPPFKKSIKKTNGTGAYFRYRYAQLLCQFPVGDIYILFISTRYLKIGN